MKLTHRAFKFRAWINEDENIHDVTSIDTEEGLIYHGKNGDFGPYKIEEECELMQFTGIRDKNGVEIYEGDIIKGNYQIHFQVYWQGGSFRANRLGFDKAGELTIPAHYFTSTEVIGNIFQNPDLL